MKLLKSIVSFFTVCMMGCAFSGGAYIDAVEQEIDISSKFSSRLIEEYGISEDSLKTSKGIQQIQENSEKLPVLVWCTNDINVEDAEQKALPTLTENMKSPLPLSSVGDVLNSGEELSAEAIQKFIETKRAESRILYEELNGQFIEKYMPDADIVYISQYSPVVVAELTLKDVINLAKTDVTEEFEYYSNDDDIVEMDISTKVTKSGLAQSTYSYIGSGVKIGQIEPAVPNITNIQLQPISNRIHIDSTSASSSSSNIAHATRVACILVGQQTAFPFQGVAATVADLYCVSSRQGLLQAVEELLDNGVNVINASISFGSDTVNTYGTYAKWLDHIAIDHNVIFVKSAGNSMNNNDPLKRGVTSGGMAYNIITVGNLDDNNTELLTDDIIRYSSSYNTNSSYAYKPDLCAPGTDIRIATDGMATGTGTSFAAPHVAGAVAMLCQIKPTLRIKPAAIKAILAACVNSDSPLKYCPSSWQSNPTSTTKCYSQYGAGLLDVYTSMTAADNNHYYASQLETYESEKSFTISVTAGSPVRISLAFLINNSFYSSTNHNSTSLSTSILRNLDLYVFSPSNQFITSSQTTNNVEILEFTPSETGLYKIKVVNNSLSLPPDVTYFGVAWEQ